MIFLTKILFDKTFIYILKSIKFVIIFILFLFAGYGVQREKIANVVCIRPLRPQ
jgi:hypothetical protein